jgi:hypothetical protein
MNFDRVSDELRNYCSANAFLANMMRIANMLILVCMIVRTVNIFISVDSIITTLVFYLFLLSIILLIANRDYVFLSIGLWWQAALYLIGMIRGLYDGYGGGTWVVSDVIHIAIYFMFAYFATQKAGFAVVAVVPRSNAQPYENAPVQSQVYAPAPQNSYGQVPPVIEPAAAEPVPVNEMNIGNSESADSDIIVADAPDTPKFCTECGAVVEAEGSFCTNCGARTASE